MWRLENEGIVNQGRRAIQKSGGALVSRAPNKPKYKPTKLGKIKSNFTDQRSIIECIEFQRLASVPGGRAPMGTTAMALTASFSVN